MSARDSAAAALKKFEQKSQTLAADRSHDGGRLNGDLNEEEAIAEALSRSAAKSTPTSQPTVIVIERDDDEDDDYDSDEEMARCVEESRKFNEMMIAKKAAKEAERLFKQVYEPSSSESASTSRAHSVDIDEEERTEVKKAIELSIQHQVFEKLTGDTSLHDLGPSLASLTTTTTTTMSLSCLPAKEKSAGAR